MKKILIVIHDMRIGGAQKSLLSFLQSLAAAEPEAAEIDLLVIDPAGEFYGQVPEFVNLLPPPNALRWLGSAFSKTLLREHFSWGSLYGQCCWLVRKTLKWFPKALNLQQRLWYSWQPRIPEPEAHYDAAIAYMDGVPGYFVMDKVKADKKYLWVHSEYQKQGYDPAFDRVYYEKADGIITISSHCKACISREFPDLTDKIHILENILSSRDILEKSREGDPAEFAGKQCLKLLTVARLNPQKGVDLAVEAAKELQREGVSFLWLVAGDGPERQTLQVQIDTLGLQDCFQLLGSRENPYVYMRCCDILVQPSRVEGRSIVLDEAKILCKPIVAANYTTVSDSLTHGKTGWVTDMTPQALAQGILKLWQDMPLRETLVKNLDALPREDTALLRRYIETMFS